MLTEQEVNNNSIVLCDDHKIFCEGIYNILTTVMNLQVVGVAFSLKELDHLYETFRPRLLITDLRVGEETALDYIRYISNRFPKNFILVLSQNDHPLTIKQVLRNGAIGFVSKSSGLNELKLGVQSAMEGRNFLCSRASLALVQDSLPGDKDDPTQYERWKLLTDREVMIIEMLAAGLNTKVIAEQLCITVKTIEKHKTNIMHKLNVNNTLQVLRIARDVGLSI